MGEVEEMLNSDVTKCCWIDCLGREIKMRAQGFDEIKSIVRINLERLYSVHDIFEIDMNNMVLDTINLCESKSSETSTIIIDKIDALEQNFIDKPGDNDSMLPIPVLSNTSP